MKTFHELGTCFICFLLLHDGCKRERKGACARSKGRPQCGQDSLATLVKPQIPCSVLTGLASPPTQGPVEVGGLSPCLTPAQGRGQSRTPLQSSAQERLWSSEGRGGPPPSLPCSPLACLLLGHLHCAEAISDPESHPRADSIGLRSYNSLG